MIIFMTLLHILRSRATTTTITAAWKDSVDVAYSDFLSLFEQKSETRNPGERYFQQLKGEGVKVAPQGFSQKHQTPRKTGKPPWKRS